MDKVSPCAVTYEINIKWICLDSCRHYLILRKNIFCTMTTTERVYIIGGTGNIGTATVRELLKKGMSVTVYARSPIKAQGLFGDNDKLAIVEGDLNDLKPFEESITGHTRLLLIVTDLSRIATLKISLAQKAYAAGVQQIVDLSSITSGDSWRTSTIGRAHRVAEEGILAIQDRGAFVALRPGMFMSNQFHQDTHSIKSMNTIVGIAEPTGVQSWISSNDIGLIASNIFQDPIEKHGDAVYNILGDLVTCEGRAQILSKILGRTITYTKVSQEQMYQSLTEQAGFPHLVAYDFLGLLSNPVTITPGLSILLGRQPETLAQYLEANKSLLL